MSLTALKEIFRDIDPSSFPSDLAKCLAGDKQAITANHVAGRAWEYRREQYRILAHFTHGPSPSATPDPAPLPLPHLDSPSFPSTESQGPTVSDPPRPTVLCPQPQVTPLLSATDNTRRTVHSTAFHAPPCLPPPQDLAQQLCTDRSASVRAENRSHWDPQVLFPEIAISTSPTVPALRIVPSKKGSTSQKDSTSQKGPISDAPSPLLNPRQLRPTDRIRIDKNQKNRSAIVDLDASDFFDIPLQYAEGRDLLSLIGAADVPIPPHLMAPLKTLPPQAELGQSSKPKPNRLKRPTPEARKEVKQASAKPPTVPKRPIAAAPSATEAPFSSPTDSPRALPTLPATDTATVNDNINEEDDPYLERVDYSGDEGLDV